MQITQGIPREQPDMLVDLADASAYALRDMHPVWHYFRHKRRISLETRADGSRIWHLFAHADCERALKRSEFSVEHGTILGSIPSGDPAGGRTITMTDPPRHRQFRHPAMSRLGFGAVRMSSQQIEADVDCLVEGVIGRTFNAVNMLQILPMIAVGRLLGFPRDTWQEIAFLTMASAAASDPKYAMGRTPEDTMRRAHFGLLGIFSETLETMDEIDTVVGALKSMTVDGRRLSFDDCLLNCYNFALGANTTTSHVAAHLLVVLATNDDVWEQVRRDPEAMAEPVVEEAARWASPTNHLVRRARSEVSIGGVNIDTGDWVCAWVASANRDESVFDKPYEFRPGRLPNPHLGFGAGPHYCIGAPAARLALRRFVTTLARRASAVRLAGEPRHLESNWINGFTELPMIIKEQVVASC